MNFLLDFLDLFRSILVDVYYELRFLFFKTFHRYFQTVCWLGIAVFANTFVELCMFFESIGISFWHRWYIMLDCNRISVKSWNESLLMSLNQIFNWPWYSLAHNLLILFWRILIFIIILMCLHLNFNLRIII